MPPLAFLFPILLLAEFNREPGGKRETQFVRSQLLHYKIKFQRRSMRLTENTLKARTTYIISPL